MPHTLKALLPAPEAPRGGLHQSEHGGEDCRITVMDAAHADRGRAEALIRDVYRERYDARIHSWMPFLAAHRNRNEVLAAAGFRPASEALYLEHYLDQPVEQAIASHTRRAPARHSIVEVGHLASRRGGAGAMLLLDLADHLHRSGFDWLVNTATADTRRLILGLRAAPLALAAADPTRLPDRGAAWGHYYDHQPVVLAIHLPSALGRRNRKGRTAA
ncbi:MAG: hypothetical protein FGM40_04110 [Rhodocyclaceae bacterium]|nr:hypothetical protein [Rhodocyclaceae bacterium]